MEDQKLEVRVDISIRDYRSGGGLQISEQVIIRSVDFMDMAAILGEFHKVAQKLKEAHGGDDG